MFDSILALSASAGSGKTYALSIRYIYLLLQGADPSRILTLTFTNKAAAEMQERILLNIAHPSDDVLQTLCDIDATPKEEMLKKLNIIYQQVLRSNLLIMTIDSFFAEILRRFALHAGISPQFGIDMREENEVTRLFLQKVRQKGLYQKLLAFGLKEKKKLSDIQTLFMHLYERDAEIKALFYEDKKTYDETHVLSAFELLKSAVLGCKVVSKSAIKEMQSVTDIEELLKKGFLKKELLSEHSYFKKCALEDTQIDAAFIALKQEIKHYFQAKENHVLHHLFLLYQTFIDAKQSYIQKYSRLTFNDVTNTIGRLLSNEIERDFLYFRLDAKIEHILLDEYQDTSTTQYAILEPLMEEATSGYGVEQFNTLFFVGDVKQSIYRFRGGAKELFSHTVERFNVTQKQMTSNYRSAKEVVEFVNDTFEHKMPEYVRQHAKKEFGFVEVEKDDEIENAAVEKLKWLLEQGVSPSHIAILTYVNKDSHTLKDRLRIELPELKVSTETTEQLAQVKSVKMVMEMLKYLYFHDSLYKENFLALLGRTQEIIAFDISTPLYILIIQIVRTYQFYDKDTNILLLLEEAMKYTDIERFIDEFEDIPLNSVKEQSIGVKILTIHKSKGLEFEHVIVCDRKTRKRPSTDTLIYAYNDVHLEHIYVRFPNRAYVDENYAKVLESEQSLIASDEINAQYVAFTRAKTSLHVLCKEKSSAFEHLGLSVMTRGTFAPAVEHVATPEISQDIVFRAKDYGRQSDIIKQESEENEDIEAIEYGIALHYMLEMCGDFSTLGIEDAKILTQNRYGIYMDKNTLSSIYARVEMLREDKIFQSLIDARLYKEQPIAFKGQLKRIDLVCEHEDKVVIVDYKSGGTSHAHVDQVQYYIDAYKEVTTKEVIGYVCYLQKEGIHFVKVYA